MSNQYDITIKDLFSDAESTQDLVTFFSKTDLRLTGDLSIEFTQLEEKRSDLVLKAGDETAPVAVHLEFQSYNDPEMGHRMLRYAGEILKKYQLPVHQTVIYFGDAEMNMDSGLWYNIEKDHRLDFRYRLVDLGQMAYDEIKNHHNQHLRAFLPLVDRKRRKKEKAKFLETCVQDIMATELPLEDKKMVLLRAEIFSGLVFEDDVIELIFRGVEEMLNLEESAGYRRIYEKGEIKGEIKAKREAIQKFLERRFGDDSSNTQKQVELLDELKILNTVLVELFGANKLEEARGIIQDGMTKSLEEKKASKA